MVNNKSIEVLASGSSNIVFDIDLRKSIKRNSNSSETDYSFVSDAELNAAVRFVNEDQSGDVESNANTNVISDLEFIVYAYEKGSFNATTENQGQGSGNILFANAVTSAKVKSDGSYKLSFIEEGDYEIHLASYMRSESDGELSLTGMANAISLIDGISLTDVQVASNSSVELDISILINL